MARVDVAAIRRQLAKDTGFANSVLKEAAKKRALVILNDSVKGLKKAFEESKVTQEIDAGIESSNLSGTLRGGAQNPPNNLYSFIGFENDSSRPTDAIRARLDPSHKDGPKISQGVKIPGPTPMYEFTVTINLEAIFKATPMPWGNGLSWAEKIETTIPGFAHFLAKKGSKNSRSGGGIQSKHEIYSGVTYIAPQDGYLNKMVQDFGDSIKNFKRQKFNN